MPSCAQIGVAVPRAQAAMERALFARVRRAALIASGWLDTAFCTIETIA